MAKVKFQSRVAIVSEEKCHDAYTDSGATQYFFHEQSSLLTYERFNEKHVKAESSTLDSLIKEWSSFSSMVEK